MWHTVQCVSESWAVLGYEALDIRLGFENSSVLDGVLDAQNLPSARLVAQKTSNGAPVDLHISSLELTTRFLAPPG